MHDAARPLATDAMFDGRDRRGPGRCRRRGARARRSPTRSSAVDAHGTVVETVPRDDLVAVQTPQAFRADALRGARTQSAPRRHRRRRAGRGAPVAGSWWSPGEPANFKVTDPADLDRAAALLAGEASTVIRVGLGYDVHPFGGDGAARARWRGRSRGARVVGHSDADAVAHAVADALLGPTGLPDLGTLFPASDPAYARRVVDRSPRAGRARVASRAAGGSANVDVVDRGRAPRLGPQVADDGGERRRGARRRRREPMGHGVHVVDRPKRGEGLGFVGRSGGDRGLGGRAARAGADVAARTEPGRGRRGRVGSLVRWCGSTTPWPTRRRADHSRPRSGVDVRVRPDRLRRAAHRPRAHRARLRHDAPLPRVARQRGDVREQRHQRRGQDHRRPRPRARASASSRIATRPVYWESSTASTSGGPTRCRARPSSSTR